MSSGAKTPPSMLQSEDLAKKCYDIHIRRSNEKFTLDLVQTYSCLNKNLKNSKTKFFFFCDEYIQVLDEMKFLLLCKKTVAKMEFKKYLFLALFFYRT